MAELHFEIWRDGESGDQEMAPVTLQGDKLRAVTMPGAVRLHTFKASSYFEASRKYNEWNGWGEWKPEPDWVEHIFTDEEADVQLAYMSSRKVG